MKQNLKAQCDEYLMKKFSYLVFTLLIIAGIYFTYNGLNSSNNPGYVLIGIGHWSLETTLIFFLVSLGFLFIIFYCSLRLLIWLFKLPGRLKSRGTNIKFNRSQEALIAGLVDSAEGNFEKAENVLIKHASHSGAPLIHYLTAARAAQSRGAFDKRDEYLQAAAAKAPDSGIAIGLTQAELHLSGKQFGEALETLSKLHTINPGHATVLKLLHQTYQHIGDWDSIRKLIPSLHTNKVLMEAEIKLLETETFSSLLKQYAEKGNTDDIELLWSEVPGDIKDMPGVNAIYFAAMIEMGASSKIEPDLEKVLSKNWNETLLVLYGAIQSDDCFKQLKMAELWLEHHQDDAVLLTVLGKLSIKCQEFEQAVKFLSRSLAIEPTVQAYQLLGDLSFLEGDKDRACKLYKSGLELASSEIVSQINNVS